MIADRSPPSQFKHLLSLPPSSSPLQQAHQWKLADARGTEHPLPSHHSENDVSLGLESGYRQSPNSPQQKQDFDGRWCDRVSRNSCRGSSSPARLTPNLGASCISHVAAMPLDFCHLRLGTLRTMAHTSAKHFTTGVSQHLSCFPARV